MVQSTEDKSHYLLDDPRSLAEQLSEPEHSVCCCSAPNLAATDAFQPWKGLVQNHMLKNKFGAERVKR